MGSLLSEALLQPESVAAMDSAHLSALIRHARCTGLLGSLCSQLQDSAALEQVPAQARRHLQSAAAVHTKHRQDVAYEISWLKKAMDSSGSPLVLLKGAAYIHGNLPLGRGRFLSDIDLLVKADQLVQVEQNLNRFGWSTGKLHPYDERYYRQWMHEIPPMHHSKRGSTLDVHHTILPPTAAANIKPELLFDELAEIDRDVFSLSPRDMVLHSATHLFHEGEFHHGLRDLWDLHCMLGDFPSREPSFWENLVDRARQLDLESPLYYGLRYTHLVYRTEIPPAIIQQTGSLKRQMRRPLMDFLFRRAFSPRQPEHRPAFTGTALKMLYVRSHYLRMPLQLLIPHLARKAWMGWKAEHVEAGSEEAN